MIDVNTSTVTFLFAETGDSISSRENSLTGMGEALAWRDRILRKAVEENGGSVYRSLERPSARPSPASGRLWRRLWRHSGISPPNGTGTLENR